MAPKQQSSTKGFAAWGKSGNSFKDVIKCKTPPAYEVMVVAKKPNDIDKDYVLRVVGNKLRTASNNLKKLGLNCKDNSMENLIEGARDLAIPAIGGKIFLATLSTRSGVREHFEVDTASHPYFNVLAQMMAPEKVGELKKHIDVEHNSNKACKETSTLGGIKDFLRSVGDTIGKAGDGEKINGGEIANVGFQILACLTNADMRSEDFEDKKAGFIYLVKPDPQDPETPLAFGCLRYNVHIKVRSYKDQKIKKHLCTSSVEKDLLMFNSMAYFKAVTRNMGLDALLDALLEGSCFVSRTMQEKTQGMLEG